MQPIFLLFVMARIHGFSLVLVDTKITAGSLPKRVVCQHKETPAWKAVVYTSKYKSRWESDKIMVTDHVGHIRKLSRSELQKSFSRELSPGAHETSLFPRGYQTSSTDSNR